MEDGNIYYRKSCAISSNEQYFFLIQESWTKTSFFLLHYSERDLIKYDYIKPINAALFSSCSNIITKRLEICNIWSKLSLASSLVLSTETHTVTCKTKRIIWFRFNVTVLYISTQLSIECYVVLWIFSTVCADISTQTESYCSLFSIEASSLLLDQ